MGNSSNKSKLDPDLLKTRGLYPQRDWDERSLKKMVQKGKIAPFYQGMTEAQSGSALEECPICMLWYDALNRSNCCQKPICSECYLQVHRKIPEHIELCPFCKTPEYQITFRGPLTDEEKSIIEQEDQKVLEASIRMRQEEFVRDQQRELERAKERQPRSADLETKHASIETNPCTPSNEAPEEYSESNEEHSALCELENIMFQEAVRLSVYNGEDAVSSSQLAGGVDVSCTEAQKDSSLPTEQAAHSPSYHMQDMSTESVLSESDVMDYSAQLELAVRMSLADSDLEYQMSGTVLAAVVSEAVVFGIPAEADANLHCSLPVVDGIPVSAQLSSNKQPSLASGLECTISDSHLNPEENVPFTVATCEMEHSEVNAGSQMQDPAQQPLQPATKLA